MYRVVMVDMLYGVMVLYMMVIISIGYYYGIGHIPVVIEPGIDTGEKIPAAGDGVAAERGGGEGRAGRGEE